jgi:hypothetical protein
VRKTGPKPPGGQAKTLAKHQEQPEPGGRPRYNFWICLVLLVTSLAVYAPVRHFDFVNFDDPEFVRDNPHVRAGLSAKSLAWAFTSSESANWFPVTRLSHVLDAQFWGMRSGPQHLTSVLFHMLAALCLFAFLRRATGAPWPSALVAKMISAPGLVATSRYAYLVRAGQGQSPTGRHSVQLARHEVSGRPVSNAAMGFIDTTSPPAGIWTALNPWRIFVYHRFLQTPSAFEGCDHQELQQCTTSVLERFVRMVGYLR